MFTFFAIVKTKMFSAYEHKKENWIGNFKYVSRRPPDKYENTVRRAYKKVRVEYLNRNLYIRK